MRPAPTEALRRLAEAYRCAIVCIRHPAKPARGRRFIAGSGSVDFIGAARTGLFVEQHPTDPGKVLLAQSKSNIGPLGHTQVFTKYDGHFEWCGVSRLSAEMPGSGRGLDPYIFLEAVCWLEQRLADGLPVSNEVLQQEATEEGITLPRCAGPKRRSGCGVSATGTSGTGTYCHSRLCPSPRHFSHSPHFRALIHLAPSSKSSSCYGDILDIQCR